MKNGKADASGSQAQGATAHYPRLNLAPKGGGEVRNLKEKLQRSCKLRRVGIDFKDSTFSFTSERTIISYSPQDFISQLTVSTIKFLNGRKGIDFSLITKRKRKTPDIRQDSIILTTYNKNILLSNPYRDTTFYRYDGGLSCEVIHILSNAEIESIKESLITEIILTVDGLPYKIRFKKKSQIKLTGIFNSSY